MPSHRDPFYAGSKAQAKARVECCAVPARDAHGAGTRYGESRRRAEGDTGVRPELAPAIRAGCVEALAEAGGQRPAKSVAAALVAPFAEASNPSQNFFALSSGAETSTPNAPETPDSRCDTSVPKERPATAAI